MIVGFTGKAKSGKDTAAQVLIDIGYKRFAFADELKEVVCGLFGWNLSDHGNGNLKDVIDPYWGFSPRRAMQLFGTEFARALDVNLWIKKAEKKIDLSYNWVITDVRFENEADFVRNNGILIHIYRPLVGDIEHHASESGVNHKQEDFIIKNDSSIGSLRDNVFKTIINR